ncbi:response regulator [Actibacterium lipolyticum]|uniref:Virulence transcriptional regulatory protein PhoP n=1 Tax=Actibacterium lipolyticum TaxID=1524263 RepID=A0A238JMZ2_9RHOB|nr:response regulator [Actibacterium lipolyticum]SMX31803.1 Virulence transcriptional regulatory protein PhoP [Actibacterium lipolyticum]
MTNKLTNLLNQHHSQSDRPLLGMTILVVEDSHFASEAMRLLCLRSGARIRRADCLRSARRHLQVYRPSVAIIDLGLPDGAGESLIAELAATTPRVGAILATSGDDGAEQRALNAGADGFLPKPVESLAVFQHAVLSRLPEEDRPVGLRTVRDERINPDPFAYRDDMVHISSVLAASMDTQTLDYVSQFLTGVARAAADSPLEEAAVCLAERRQGLAAQTALSHLSGLVEARIKAAGPV